MRVLHHAPPSHGGRRIFVAIPTYGPLPALTAFALFESYPALEAAGVDVELCILSGHCHVDDARNLLVARFLESAADELVFIDADMGWQPTELARLATHDRDVVAGCYRLKKDQAEYVASLVEGEIWADSDGLIEAKAVPTGFLKIRRRVLEQLAADAPRYRPEAGSERTVAEIFARTTVDGTRVGGDYAFCRKWRAAGGRIFVDPDLWLEHVGEKVYAGSYATYLRQLNGLELTDGIARIQAGTFQPDEIIRLAAEWGNPSCTASHELLVQLIHIARQVRGPIIETGSGLSSLVMAAAGAEVHSIENDPIWASAVARARDRLGLERLTVHYAPLTSWGDDGHWYDVVGAAVPWKRADVVVCDGPLRHVANRRILWRVMAERECWPRAVFIDDSSRRGQLEPLAARGYEISMHGTIKPFAIAKRCQDAEARVA